MPGITDEELDLLDARVPMDSEDRPAVDQALAARRQRRVLADLHGYHTEHGVRENEKELFVRAFWSDGLGLDAADLDAAGGMDELFERAAGTLSMLHGEKSVHEFLKLDEEEQRAQVEQVEKGKALQATADNRPMTSGWIGFARKSSAPKPVTEEQTDAALKKTQEDAFMQSPKLVMDAFWPRMDQTARTAAIKSLFYKNPAHAFEAIDPLLDELSPEQLRMFSAVATAARPEMEKAFGERYGIAFAKVFRRRAENAKYFVRAASAGNAGTPLGLYRRAEKLGLDVEAHLENPTPESTTLFKKLRTDAQFEQGMAGGKGVLTAEALRKMGMIDGLSDDDVLGMYRAGQKMVEWEERYNAVSHAVQERYKPLPSFQEYVLQGHEIAVDMTSLAVVTFAGNAVTPGAGIALAAGSTWMDHQAEMERTLIYDHGMDAVDAKMWSGFYAAPYAAIEYAQVKGFEKFMPQGLEGFRGLERTAPKLFAWYFPQYVKRAAAGTAHETMEEVLQAGVDFALMETARNFYETEGITFDDNAQAFWDETIGAVKYMWMAGFTGGGVTGVLEGGKGLATGKGIGGFLGPELKMAVRDAALPLGEFEAEVGLRRASKDYARMAAETGFKDGVPDEVLELVRSSEFGVQSSEVDVEARLEQMGYENPSAVVEMAQAEIEKQDRTRDLLIARLNTLEEQFEAESGQDEFVIPEHGPKYGQVELALSANGWAQGLGLELQVVETPAEIPGQAAPKGAKAAIVGNTVYMVNSNLTGNADAYAQFRHEVLGHVGFDLSKNAGDIVAKITGLLGLDYIRARLPQYAALHEAGTLTDAGLVEEFLSVMASDLRRASLEEDERGVLDKAKEWLVRSLGVESVAQMTGRETVAAVREVMNAAFEGGSLQKVDDSKTERALYERQRTEAGRLRDRKREAERRIQQMMDVDPVLSAVMENGGIKMPTLKPGQSYPDEYAAIPVRFRGKRGAGLELYEAADQAGLSDEELRAVLEQAEAKFEQILEGSTTEGTEAQSEQELLRQLEAGEISEAEYDAAMNELAPRFSVMREDLTVSEDVDKASAEFALEQLAGKDLENDATGIVAQINRNQREKLISLAALKKSQKNGYTAGQHNAAAARIELLWKHALKIEERDSEAEHSDDLDILRFGAPVLFDGEVGIAYITAKRTDQHGSRIYSLELTEIEKLRDKGGKPKSKPEGSTTPEAVSMLAQLAEKVKNAPRMALGVVSDDLKALGVDAFLTERGGVIVVEKLVVPEDKRSQGVGSAAMQRVIDYADESGKVIALSPSTDFGASSVKRLKTFYKRFGFVENKGRNKDFSVSESMIRLPKAGNKPRFSVEQHVDPERAVAIVAADRLLRGDKLTAGRVKTLLKQTGANGVRAKEVLARAKEIAAEANAKRSLGGNLAELIGRAEMDNFKARLLEEAHRMGSRDGAFRQQAEDEVNRLRSERQKYARQLAVALTSADLDDADHIDISNLWKKLILEERVRRPRRADETEREYGERLEADGVSVELVDVQSDEFALPVKDWLFEVRRSVLRSLMKQGVPVPEMVRAMSDPVVKAAYMQTVENLLREKVQELTYGEKRARLEKRIAALSARKQLKGFEQAVDDVLFEMFNAAVDQNRQEWIEAAWKLTDRVAKGRIKSRQSAVSRPVAGRVQLMFKDVRSVMRMDAATVDAEIEALLLTLEAAGTLEEQQELRDRLSVLNRFGGLQFKKLGEIADAVTWLQETLFDELEKQQKRLEKRKAAAKGWKETILASLPRRRVQPDGVTGGVRNLFTQAMALKLRLNDLVRYGAPAAVEKARAQMDGYAERISAANSRRMIEENRAHGWLKESLQRIYGEKDTGPVWNELTRSRDEFAQYSDDGLAMSKTQLMQLVATFAQAEYAQAAQKVLRHEAALAEMAAEMGVSLETLKGRRASEYAGMELTRAFAAREELDVFEAGQLIAAAVEEGSRLGRQYEAAQRILRDGAVDEKDLALIDELRTFYRESRAPLSAVLEEITGLPIPGDMDPKYVPVKKQYMNDGLNAGGQRMPVVPAGLSRRVSNFRSFDESADLLDLWNSRMQDNAQFKNFGALFQDLGVLFNDADVLHRMEVTHGKPFARGLIDHLKDTMSGRPDTVKQDSLGALIVNAKTYTALGFNMGLLPRQITSYPAFGYFVGFGELAGYIADLKTEEGWETFKMVFNSDWAKARRQTGNTQILNESLAKIDKLKGVRRYKEFAMWATMYGDAIPIAMFGSGYYRAMKVEAARRGMADNEIHEWAMNKLWEVVELSQQSGAIMNRSEWQRSSHWASRAFGMFTSTPQQYMSMQVDAWREYRAAKESGDPARRKAALKHFQKVGVINHVLLPLGYNGMKMLINALLGAGFDEDDAKDLFLSMILGPFSGLYVGGAILQGMLDVAVNGKQYYTKDLLPVNSVMRDAELFALAAREFMTLNWDELPEIFHEALKNNFAPYRDVSKAWENYGL